MFTSWLLPRQGVSDTSPRVTPASFEQSLRTSWRSSAAPKGDRFRALVFGCVHAPYTSEAAWEWFTEILAREGPTLTHLICTGDWLDMSAVSHHPNEDKESCRQEYESAAQQSRVLRSLVSRKCKLLRLNGNHEDRLEGGIFTPQRLRSQLHWTAHEGLNAEWSQWTSKPYVKGERGSFSVGPLLVHHGFDFGLNSDESEALHMVRATGWLPNRLIVRSHTHRPTPPTPVKGKGSQPLPWWYANVGHLGPTKPQYTWRRDTSQWGHGCLLVEGSLNHWRESPSFDSVLFTRPPGST